MIVRLVSLLIVLGIIGLFARGMSLIPEAPGWVVRTSHAACGLAAAVLILNFVLGVLGHPLFLYGGTEAP